MITILWWALITLTSVHAYHRVNPRGLHKGRYELAAAAIALTVAVIVGAGLNTLLEPPDRGPLETVMRSPDRTPWGAEMPPLEWLLDTLT